MLNSATTSLKFHDFTYTWIIAGFNTNFKNYSNEDGIISSPVFIADNTNEKYQLRLHVQRYISYGFHQWVYGFFCKNHRPSSDISRKASIRISFVDNFNIEVLEKETLSSINDDVKFEYKKESIEKLVTNENLTIKCRIRFHNGLSHAVQTNPSSFMVPRPSILDDLKNLLFTTNLSDVKLIVNKEKFQVHKSILAARSPVFSAMFQVDMREKKESIVEIDDIKPAVMKEVLNFIYTDKVNIDYVPITDLLAAADKYQIESLRIICLEAIVSRLSIDNVVEVLAITDRYDIPALQDYTINFLASKRAEIVAKKNWNEVMKSLPPPMLMKLTTVLMQKI